MKPILVTAYTNPDLDGTACAFAYAEFLNKTGRKAVASIKGTPHREAQFLFDHYNIPAIDNTLNPTDFDAIALVDTSQLTGIDERIDRSKVIEIIDHRKHNDIDQFPKATSQIELVGAAATLIAEKFQKQNVPISREAAILLYGAIISNTLNFKSKTTTTRDGDMAAWLNAQIAMPASFAHDLFMAKSDVSGQKLEQAIRDDFAVFSFSSLGVGQLELIGAKEVACNRTTEILEALSKLRQELDLSLIFLSLIDLEEGCNYFVAADPKAIELLKDIFRVEFTDNVARYPNLIMRKEIIPLIKEKLIGEKNG